MKFNIGDRVRFLSEKGGGVIVKIKNNTTVIVHSDDDFDIPYLVKDLVKIEPASSVHDLFHTESDRKEAKLIIEKQSESSENEFIENERHSRIIRNEHGHSLSDGLYLAWFPLNQNLLISSDIDLFLLNNTRFDVLFSLFLHNYDNSFSGVDYDAIPPYHKTLLHSFGRDKLEKWSKGIVQLLFHVNKNNVVLDPANIPFKIAPVRFYKDDNYLEYSILKGYCLMVELITMDALHMVNNQTAEKTIATKIGRARQALPDPFIKKYLTSPHEAVVDLHIEALSDAHRQMTEYEILTFQLRFFQQSLDNAISNNLHKITFIHGVGQGVLKKEMLEILHDYKKIEIREAPMRQFGYGAMEIVIGT